METLCELDVARIVEPNLDILLFNRLKNKLDATPPFLDKLREMYNFLVQAVKPITRLDGQTLLMKLCRAVSICIGKLRLFMVLGRVSQSYFDNRASAMGVDYLKAPLDLQQKIIAAIAVDDHDLLRNLLPESLRSPSPRSPLFGSSLSFAISHGDAGVVRTILQCMLQHGAHGLTFADALVEGHYGTVTWHKTSAMDFAITTKQPRVLEVIVDFQKKHGRSLLRKEYKALLSRAIFSGKLEMVKAVFCLKVTGGVKVTLGHLNEAAGSHNEDILLAIITSPGMRVDKAYTDASPLRAAVRSGNVHMVRAVLNAGPDIDMKVRGRPALVEAMMAGKDVIAQALLDHGAAIPPRATWPEDTPKTHGKYRGVREVLENEQRRRSGR